MLSPDLLPIINAINAGDKARARDLAKSLLRVSPSAEGWYQASRAMETPQQELSCLQRALGLDPYHADARRRLRELQAGQTSNEPSAKVADTSAEQPPSASSSAPPLKKSRSQKSSAPAAIATDVPLKKVRRRRKRGTWFYVGILATVLLSLSASYFVMLVLGSPLPGRLRGMLGGAQPVTEIDGVPLKQIPDAVLKIPPSSSSEVTQTEPLAEILEPGVVHEYTFYARNGEELAIGIQFFSPTAQRVNRNIAILDPQGDNAEGQCLRQHILQGDNGAAITCRINRSGNWQVHILGRVDESSGAYVVSVGRLMS